MIDNVNKFQNIFMNNIILIIKVEKTYYIKKQLKTIFKMNPLLRTK